MLVRGAATGDASLSQAEKASAGKGIDTSIPAIIAFMIVPPVGVPARKSREKGFVAGREGDRLAPEAKLTKHPVASY